MALDPHVDAGLGILGKLCDAVGGLYLAFDIFRRHKGPLGILTRAATYSVVIGVPAWPVLGAAFGAILGACVGSAIAAEYWLLARRQRLLRSSPLNQSWGSGAARGLMIGAASVPRFGLKFGVAMAVCEGALLSLVYGLGLIPTHRYNPERQFDLPPRAFRGAIYRALAMGLGAAIAAFWVWGIGAAEHFGPEIAGLVCVLGFLMIGVAPVVEYWTERATDSFFVYAGLGLLFCGLIFDVIPDVFKLFEPR